MPEDQSTTQTPSDAEREAESTRATPPRGNQEPDRASVEKGKEQLDKISGN
jgi:hypothetical protein